MWVSRPQVFFFLIQESRNGFWWVIPMSTCVGGVTYNIYPQQAPALNFFIMRLLSFQPVASGCLRLSWWGGEFLTYNQPAESTLNNFVKWWAVWICKLWYKTKRWHTVLCIDHRPLASFFFLGSFLVARIRPTSLKVNDGLAIDRLPVS